MTEPTTNLPPLEEVCTKCGGSGVWTSWNGKKKLDCLRCRGTGKEPEPKPTTIERAMDK